MVKPLSLPLLLYLDKHHDWLAGSLLKGKSFHGCLKFQSLVCLCWKIYLRRPQHLSFSLAQTLCSFFYVITPLIHPSQSPLLLICVMVALAVG